MPTKHVSVEVMKSGAGGKHWTRAEKEAREKASELVKRPRAKGLYPPAWLDKKALLVWKRVTSSVKDMELLDNLDTELLAVYCDAYSHYQVASNTAANVDDIKAAQAWARIVAQYADKLGFTPAARARLVKKRADDLLKRDKFGDEFD